MVTITVPSLCARHAILLFFSACAYPSRDRTRDTAWGVVGVAMWLVYSPSRALGQNRTVALPLRRRTLYPLSYEGVMRGLPAATG